MVGNGTLTLDIGTEVLSYLGHLWSLGHLTASQHLTFFSPRKRRAEEGLQCPAPTRKLLCVGHYRNGAAGSLRGCARSGRGCSRLGTEGSSLLCFWPTLVSSSSIPCVWFPLLLFFLPRASFLCKEGTALSCPLGGCRRLPGHHGLSSPIPEARWPRIPSATLWPASHPTSVCVLLTREAL